MTEDSYQDLMLLSDDVALLSRLEKADKRPDFNWSRWDNVPALTPQKEKSPSKAEIIQFLQNISKEPVVLEAPKSAKMADRKKRREGRSIWLLVARDIAVPPPYAEEFSLNLPKINLNLDYYDSRGNQEWVYRKRVAW